MVSKVETMDLTNFIQNMNTIAASPANVDPSKRVELLAACEKLKESMQPPLSPIETTLRIVMGVSCCFIP